MQQKLFSRASESFLLKRSGQACAAPSPSSDLPFRCPRCGDQERFRTLASLRAHLEHRHSYRTPDPLSRSFSITGKHPDPGKALVWQEMSLPPHRGQQNTGRALHVRSLSDTRDGGFVHGSHRRRTQSVGVGTQDNKEEKDAGEAGGYEEQEGEAEGKEENLFRKSDPCQLRLLNHHHLPAPCAAHGPPLDHGACTDTDDQCQYFGLETAVRQRLASLLRVADSTMQRRLARVSTELAQTDTQLLCERAHSQHLAQERREVAERERSLSRQVDVAVMVIATLREQLNTSENELEQREREVITIQKFLEAVAHQETCGKVRIQCFIENLLRRIALAERLVEYYQENASPPQCSHYQFHQQLTDKRPHRMSKSRSAGGQLSSGLHDNGSHSSSQLGGCPVFSESSRDREREHRERLAQSSRLFCRPEHRDGIWNQQRRRSAGYEV